MKWSLEMRQDECNNAIFGTFNWTMAFLNSLHNLQSIGIKNVGIRCILLAIVIENVCRAHHRFVWEWQLWLDFAHLGY